MALGHNTSSLFEEAKGLLTEPFACYKLMTSNIHLTLPPRSLGNARKGILDQLNTQLRLYNERLNGMLVAYNHVRIQQRYGSIMTSQPDVHFDIIAEFIIFQPTPGSVLKAVITKTERSSVGCLVHGCFNASFPLLFQDDGGTKHEYQIGEEVLIEVQKIFTTRDGLISMRAKPANPELVPQLRGQKRSRLDMESVDSGFGNSSFATPVSSPPKKKHKSETVSLTSTLGPSATSTPFPASHLFRESSNDDSVSGDDVSRKKRKRKREDHDASISFSISSDNVDAVFPESSSRSSKKKKDKDPDKRSRTLNRSHDVFHVSMSEISNFSSSGLESITDTEKKRKKEKRKSDKRKKHEVSLEMSDCSSSSVTMDSGISYITATGERKKKHKKKDRDS